MSSLSILGDITIGEEPEVSISFSPKEDISEGIYTFYLRVAGYNYQTTHIGLYVSVTQSGIGNVLFKVSDIYTGTLDENEELIQGLSGVSITVQNEEGKGCGFVSPRGRHSPSKLLPYSQGK